MLELGTVGAVEGVTLIKGAVGTMKEYLDTLRRNPTIVLQDHAKVARVAADIQIQIESGRQKVGVEIVRVLNEFARRYQKRGATPISYKVLQCPTKLLHTSTFNLKNASPSQAYDCRM